jgi:hypothetical protein
MAGEQGTRREEQPAAGQTAGQAGQTMDQEKTEKSPPYGMIVALAALVLVSGVAALVLIIYKNVFTEATDITSVLGALFTVVGSVVGAYFGVKASSDATDKTQGAIQTANNLANQALAKWPPEIGSQVVGTPPRQR